MEANSVVVIALILLALAAAYVLLTNRKKGASTDAPIVRGESILIDSDDIYYIRGITPLSANEMEYRLLAGDDVVEVKKTFDTSEVKVWSMLQALVGRPIFVTVNAIDELAKLVDLSEIKKNFANLKADYELLQAQHISLKSTIDRRVDDRVSDAVEILKSVPRMKSSSR
jgi:hypothetical protein